MVLKKYTNNFLYELKIIKPNFATETLIPDMNHN